jgi:hypothetical protein
MGMGSFESKAISPYPGVFLPSLVFAFLQTDFYTPNLPLKISINK